MKTSTQRRPSSRKSADQGTRYVYLFTQVEEAEKKVGGDWDKVRGLLGGKGANLADMTRLGPEPAAEIGIGLSDNIPISTNADVTTTSLLLIVVGFNASTNIWQ